MGETDVEESRVNGTDMGQIWVKLQQREAAVRNWLNDESGSELG